MTPPSRLRRLYPTAAALLTTAALSACAVSPPAQPSQSAALDGAPWVADLGNGRYRNPVLHADYADPDAIRVGDRFYMTASSFSNVPGLPLL